MNIDKNKSYKEGSSDPDDGFPTSLGAPAMRALANAGYTHLRQLALVREDEIKKLHGIGPHALKVLRAALNEVGLNFKSG